MSRKRRVSASDSERECYPVRLNDHELSRLVISQDGSPEAKRWGGLTIFHSFVHCGQSRGILVITTETMITSLESAGLSLSFCDGSGN